MGFVCRNGQAIVCLQAHKFLRTLEFCARHLDVNGQCEVILMEREINESVPAFTVIGKRLSPDTRVARSFRSSRKNSSSDSAGKQLWNGVSCAAYRRSWCQQGPESVGPELSQEVLAFLQRSDFPIAYEQ